MNRLTLGGPGRAGRGRTVCLVDTAWLEDEDPDWESAGIGGCSRRGGSGNSDIALVDIAGEGVGGSTDIATSSVVDGSSMGGAGIGRVGIAGSNLIPSVPCFDPRASLRSVERLERAVVPPCVCDGLVLKRGRSGCG